MRDYIRCFSQKCHELPKIYDVDVISAFWSDTNCQTLVHELRHDQPKITNELLDIATRHASGDEVAGAIFVQSSGKAAPDGSRGVPPKTNNKGTKRAPKEKKGG
jgi:hypothetical protein